MRIKGAPNGAVLVALAFVPIAVVTWTLIPSAHADHGSEDNDCIIGVGCDPTTGPEPTPTPRPTPTPVVPEPPTLDSPQGVVAVPRTGYLWSREPRASSYRLTITDASGAAQHDSVYASTATCDDQEHCLARPGVSLPPGVYHWRVASIVDGVEYLSAPQDFEVLEGSLPRIIYHHHTRGMLRAAFLRDGAIVGEAPFDAPRVVGPRVADVADVNRDGRADILWSTPQLWTMNGLELAPGSGWPVPPAWNQIRALADFDGNGTPDVLSHTSGGESGLFQYMQGSILIGTRVFPGFWVPGNHPSRWKLLLNWYVIGAADFNRDQSADLVWWNSATGDTKVWFMQGHERIGEAALPPTRSFHAWRVRGVADVDGDGDADILRWNHVDGRVGAWIVEHNADGSLATSEVAFGADPDLKWRVVGFLPPDGPPPSDPIQPAPMPPPRPRPRP